MAEKLSALLGDRALPQEVSSRKTETYFEARKTGKLKKSITSLEPEPAIFWPVVECLNNFHYFLNYLYFLLQLSI
jgi:hypothetical protein